MFRLNFYKTHPAVQHPKFATKQSACFDLAFSSAGKREYAGYNSFNSPFTRTIQNDGKIVIMPGDRIMIPTGLILDIPEGYSVRIHARSGLSLKQGLTLINSEGVIDADYIEELFVLLTNTSENSVTISNGDRIAQGELVKKEEYGLWEITTKPFLKTDRVGGMGSTGISSDESVEVIKIKTPKVSSKNDGKISIKT
jgi:dUTP pyrophosphatase